MDDRNKYFYCFQGFDTSTGSNYIDSGIWLSHGNTGDSEVLRDIEDHCLAMIRNKGCRLIHFGMTAFNRVGI